MNDRDQLGAPIVEPCSKIVQALAACTGLSLTGVILSLCTDPPNGAVLWTIRDVVKLRAAYRMLVAASLASAECEQAAVQTQPTPLRFGVYRKIEGRTGVGMLYQLLMLARHHTTGAHAVVYIPLRIEPEWAGTIRPCFLERAEFERKFEFVGEALPA